MQGGKEEVRFAFRARDGKAGSDAPDGGVAVRRACCPGGGAANGPDVLCFEAFLRVCCRPTKLFRPAGMGQAREPETSGDSNEHAQGGCES